jgi:hypothetical protein
MDAADFDPNDLRSLLRRLVPVQAEPLAFDRVAAGRRRQVIREAGIALTTCALVGGIATAGALAATSSASDPQPFLVRPASSSPSASPAASHRSDLCTAGTLRVSHMTEGPGYSPAGEHSDFVVASVRDIGASCLFVIPSRLEVLPPDSGSRSVAVRNNRRSVYQVQIITGHAVRLTLGAWWGVGANLTSSSPAVRCVASVSQVDAVDVPLSSGALHIPLTDPWRSVCSSPATTSIEVSHE